MAGWNSGVFTGLYSWLEDQANGIRIRADRHTQQDDTFIAGINNCLTKDGQNNPTGNLPMATFRHTNVGNATERNQYLTMGQFQDRDGAYYTLGGVADAYTLASSPTITALVEGQTFVAKVNATNTGASTLAVSGLAATPIKKNVNVDLEAGDFVINDVVQLTYDGTNFLLTGNSRGPNGIFNSISANNFAVSALETQEIDTGSDTNLTIKRNGETKALILGNGVKFQNEFGSGLQNALTLKGDSSTPAAIALNGEDSASNETTYGSITTVISSDTNGSEDGAVAVNASKAGVVTQAIRTGYDASGNYFLRVGNNSLNREPGFVSAWAKINNLTILDSYGIASVSNINTSTRQINLSTAMQNANYSIFLLDENTTVGLSPQSQTVNNFRIFRTSNFSSAVNYYVLVIGDQNITL